MTLPIRQLNDAEILDLLKQDVALVAGRIVEKLGERGETLACGESLTGGLLADAIVSVPGASRVFLGSLVTYATSLKHRILSVDDTLLGQRGAVDPEVAFQMARGVGVQCGATHQIATTGVAGPDQQDGKPVGTVFIGYSDEDATGSYVLSAHFSARVLEQISDAALITSVGGPRGTIRQATVAVALADFERRLG